MQATEHINPIESKTEPMPKDIQSDDFSCKYKDPSDEGLDSIAEILRRARKRLRMDEYAED